MAAPRSTSLTRYAWLSIFAAVLTISLKAGAYFITGSISLLSDALESFVNLAAALVALGALSVAERPPDEDHEYGHDKVEYFSSGVEGTLILFAAASIAITAIARLLHPEPLEQINIGLFISLAASLVNWGVAHVLFRAAREHDSITLEANAQHLLTDVWTSFAVIAALILVALTGAEWLDPLVALLVALNIVRAGIQLVHRSADGLMDTTIASEQRAAIEIILEGYRTQGIDFHALRTRQSASRQFITLHVLVPGSWTVQHGHNLLEKIEQDIRAAVPRAHVTTHLEPFGDPAAMADIALDRSIDTAE
jgi:cation diffusion facilitator family transporter